MTIETKLAIDAKIAQIGTADCIKFIRWIYPDVDAFALDRAAVNGGIVRRIHAILRGENWDDLTQLFLDFDPRAVQLG